MMIRVRLAVATALGLLVAGVSALPVLGQDGVIFQNTFGVDNFFNSFTSGGLQKPKLPATGTWSEVISVTPRWMVVQNQAGQQFPISSDRVRQFLIRWPSSTDALSNQSIIEVMGPEASSGILVTDHIDIYEGSAQGLVTPSVNNLFGNNRSLSSFDIYDQTTRGALYFMTPDEYAMPSRMHVVGRSVGDGSGSVRVAGPSQSWFTVQPSGNGMSVTQVTLGNNSYAKPGDLIYVVPESMGPRSLDVAQLVLYKKIPLRMFQP